MKTVNIQGATKRLCDGPRVVDRRFGRALFYRRWPDGQASIDHFAVVCLISWPSNESEAGVGLLSMETPVLFLC